MRGQRFRITYTIFFHGLHDTAAVMRPLFIVSDLEVGGAQRVVVTVLRHLSRKGHKPHLAVVTQKGPLSSDLPGEITTHELKARRVRFSFIRVLRLCWAIRPDVVISTVGHLNILLLLLKPFMPKGTAVVIREANTPSIRLKHTRHPRLYGFCYRNFYPFSDKLVCNCRYMKEDLVSHFGAASNRISVIQNPVDVKRISSQILSETDPYPPDRIHIVSVGRLQYQKGFDLLLRSFKQCLGNISGVHLTIVGEGPERDRLRSMTADLGISEEVTFTGQKQPPFAYMAHADFLVCASRWEGSPNAVLESLACGTPVLAFDCPGGVSEIVEEGRNGWLVPAEDINGMTEKMSEIIAERSWLGMKGRNLLPSEYLIENVIRRWEDVLQKIMEEKVGCLSKSR